MSKIRVSSYTYVPSYIYDENSGKSKYVQLTETYQPLFLRFTLGETLTEEEKETFFIGIKHYSDYIANAFLHEARGRSLSKLSKKCQVALEMFRSLSKLHGEGFIEDAKEEIYDLAETSVFYALSLEKYKNRDSFIWKPVGEGDVYINLLVHLMHVVFPQLLYNNFAVKLSGITQGVQVSEEENTNNEYDKLAFTQSSDILENSGISNLIPCEIKKNIIMYLDHGECENLEEIKPYLVKIHEHTRKNNNGNK